MAVAQPDELLAAKLATQSRANRWVARERLQARLGDLEAVRLVLVSAPAGFGKTTLLTDWLGSANARSSWLSLDPGDNDIVRFCRYLAAAAGRLLPSTGPEPGFDAARQFDSELALSFVLHQLAITGSDERGAMLVLDDYHLIDEPAIHRLVASLVERLPARCVVTIATRADPPLPLARLRARGELVEVRAADLRFTVEEADELLRSAGVALPQAKVEELTARTEGWAAALRLAAISLRDRPDQDELVHRFGASHRFVLDYVVEEVLAGLPADTQEFLLRTSILERLAGPLCDAMTGGVNGQERLEDLERANLLIVPLDEERRWYRYHALFAEILRARLASLHPGEVAELHARASAWHEQHGDDDAAIRHALRSGDHERMGRVVALASGRHLNAGELGTVRRWLDALPGEVVHENAQLSAAYAWYFMIVGETDAAATWLAEAEEALADGRDGGPMMRPGIPSQIAMLRSQLAGLRGESDVAIAEARRAGDLVPAGLGPEAEAILRGTAGTLLALALLRAGDPDAAADAYTAALPDLAAGGNALAFGRAIADLAGIAIARGDPAGAVRLCESELARESGRPTGASANSQSGAAANSAPSASAASPPSASADGVVWAALARARADLGQADSAEAAARRALDLATRAGDAPVARSAQATLARLATLREAASGASPSSGGSPGALVESLTTREVEVLRLVALGRSNSQIAGELFVTVGTIKSHVHAIAGKLGASNRVESVARGRELGILD